MNELSILYTVYCILYTCAHAHVHATNFGQAAWVWGLGKSIQDETWNIAGENRSCQAYKNKCVYIVWHFLKVTKSDCRRASFKQARLANVCF